VSTEALLRQLDVAADAPGGVQKVRELILQLAVRGKLVPQDPSDEPANVLLERIAAEKQRLFGPGKRATPKAALPVDHDEAPFDVPEGWEWGRLEDLGTVNPRNHMADDLIAAFCPMALLPQRYGAAISYEERPWRDIKSGYSHFADNDVVVAKITPCFQNGKAAVMSNLPNGAGAGTTELHVFRPFPETIAPEFVLIFLRSPSFVHGGIRTMTGTAGQQRVSKEYFAKAPFAVPPIAEQRRIVAKVDELMALCDRLEARQQRRAEARVRLNRSALHHLTEAVDDEEVAVHWNRLQQHFDLLYDTPETVAELRQAVRQLAVRGKLVPQDPRDEPASVLLEGIAAERQRMLEAGKIGKLRSLPRVDPSEVPFEVPEGWGWARFAQVAHIASNLVSPDGFGDLPHVAPDCIEKGTGRLLEFRTVAEDGVRSGKHRFYAGQVLYSKIRPNLSKAVLIDFDGLCSADMYPVDSHIEAPYLLTFILSRVFLSMAIRNDTRVAMPKINQDDLYRIVVPVPPLSEQRRIVTKVDQLMTLCDHLESRLVVEREKSTDLASSLVHHLTAA
jgi:type I restriction enzyme, S subunit